MASVAPSPSSRVPRAVVVLREPLGVALDTWRAPLLLRGASTDAVALLGDWAGGSRAVIAPGPGVPAADAADPFTTLEDLPAIAPGTAVPEGTVGGGWFGLLGYPLGRALEPVGGPPPRPAPLPPSALTYHDHVVRQDGTGEWWLEGLAAPGDEAALHARFADLRARAAAVADAAPRPVRTGPWRATPSATGHAAAVEACVLRIHHGDLFQANLCQRLEATLDGDLLDVFTTAWRALRPAKAAFVRGAWGAVASLSPELYLRRRGRTVVSSPIKGTRPRGPDAVADHEARQELLAAEKDRAEHVMIVDLVRNDLGRVCAPGSVHVPALAQAREAPGVWHLVSDVCGTLREDVGDGALVRATFPPGSVTGAPKVAAMRVIHELESTGRETYTGAVGLAGPLCGLDLNVAIRTFEAAGDAVWLGVGGGIVADSTGEEEAREAADKAAPLLAAIGAPPFAAGHTAPGGPAPAVRPARPGPVPLPRPAPEAGVFETLLVLDGVVQRLDEHLARLSASTIGLYDDAVPLRPLVARLRDAAAALPARGRLRVDVRPGPDGALEVAVDGSAAPAAADRPAVLHPVVVPGGTGAHKWADRRLWDALGAEHPDGVVLAVDLDGLVLEASRANVVVRRDDGTYVTPPLDGRILPGTTRARWLAELRAGGAVVEERALPLTELAGAAEVWLTGALRGVEPAVLAG